VPRAATTTVAGWHGDAIKIRIAAPPQGGAANAELVRFLAERLGVPRRAIEITTGEGQRRKHVTVQGIEPAAAIARLVDPAG